MKINRRIVISAISLLMVTMMAVPSMAAPLIDDDLKMESEVTVVSEINNDATDEVVEIELQDNDVATIVKDEFDFTNGVAVEPESESDVVSESTTQIQAEAEEVEAESNEEAGAEEMLLAVTGFVSFGMYGSPLMYYENGVQYDAGWHKINGRWYLFDNKKMTVLGWYADDQNRKYYFDEEYYSYSESGEETDNPDFAAMVTGWRTIAGLTYYFGNDGVLTNGWQKINGTWYYFDASGVMQTGWVNASGNWYYMNASGAMETGWVNVSGSWYYMNTSGAMETGWVNVSGSWYYMNASGVMQVGWNKINGRWYYMNASGAMQTGWVNVSGSCIT